MFEVLKKSMNPTKTLHKILASTVSLAWKWVELIACALTCKWVFDTLD